MYVCLRKLSGDVGLLVSLWGGMLLGPSYHCLDRTPDCTFLGTGSLLPRWRTGKPARGRYLFYNHFISILIVIQYQRPDLRTLYAFLQSGMVSLSQKSHRYGYGGIISSPFVYILIFYR